MLNNLPCEIRIKIFQQMIISTHHWSAEVWCGERTDGNKATTVNGYVKWLLKNEKRVQNGMPPLRSYYTQYRVK